MKVTGVLLLLAVSAVGGASQPKAMWQFAQVIECVQPDTNILKYNEYGCWCGFGGSGTPVDAVDSCCRSHDACYEESRKVPGCTGLDDLPYFINYNFTCSNRQVTCSAANDKCAAAVCECDRVVAHCFAQHPYNPEYKDLDRKFCLN